MDKVRCGCGFLAAALLFAGCRPDETISTGTEEGALIVETQDPAKAGTLQADIAATANQLSTLAPVATPTDAPLPTFDLSLAVGTPISALGGLCPVPEGYVVHTREEFCIASPALWIPLNIDGGLAAVLNSTPGKMLFLRPDWADSSDVCNLFIYTASENSAEEHLETRHTELASGNDLTQLTDVAARSLGDIMLPGFLWESPNGSSGGTFAERLGPNRLLHISYSGTQCTMEQIAPVTNTLRFSALP